MSEKAYPPEYPAGIPPPQAEPYQTAPGYQPVPTAPPGVYYMPPGPQGQQQQQPQIVVTTQPQVVLVANKPSQSFVCHIVLSCFVTLCCGCLFGLIAFILAMVGQSKAGVDPPAARKLGRASIGLSIAGIIIGVIITVIIVVLKFLTIRAANEAIQAFCPYLVNDVCYNSRESAIFGSCPDSTSYTYYENYCYRQNM